MAVFCVVSSLQNHCLRAVACQLPNHETSLYALPVEIKAKLIHLLSKRGLLTDSNIEKVLHPSLRDLELCECRISDSGLASLCVCENLRKLDLNATKNSRDDITSEGVIKVFTSCCQLQTVYLRRCINVSDTAIITLTENCRHLEHLNLCGCINITDTSLHVLAKNCRFLQSLNISKTKVTDNGIMQLTTGKCRQSIKEVQVSHCIHITDASIEALLALCPRINILIFDGCPHVTESSRHAIEEAGQLKQLSWTVYWSPQQLEAIKSLKRRRPDSPKISVNFCEVGPFKRKFLDVLKYLQPGQLKIPEGFLVNFHKMVWISVWFWGLVVFLWAKVMGNELCSKLNFFFKL